jgi:protein gp37
VGKTTAIAWCDATFNPWWGCTKVSPGCAHCYAENIATRYGHDVWGPKAGRRLFDDRHWHEPELWNRAAGLDGIRRRVFCGSMCDIFEDLPTLYGQRARLFELIEATPDLDWLLLTKRPENITGMAPAGFGLRPNVWLGTSVEDQLRASQRVPALLQVEARKRFLSVEPLLEPVRLMLYNTSSFTDADGEHAIATEWIDWVIVGGESGPGARPMDPDWVGSILRRCRDNRVAFFMKQLGGHPDKRAHPEMWPAELRIQQFPELAQTALRPADPAPETGASAGQQPAPGERV